MGLRRVLLSLVLVLCVVILAQANSLSAIASSAPRSNDLLYIFHPFQFSLFLNNGDNLGSFEDTDGDRTGRVIKTPTDGGIRVEIPDRSKDKFESWKAELLSTDFGR